MIFVTLKIGMSSTLLGKQASWGEEETALSYTATFKAAKKCNFGQITLMAKMKGFFKLLALEENSERKKFVKFHHFPIS